MFTKMLGFEWRYFTRQPSFIVTCLIFFLLPFLAITIDQVQIGSGGNVLFNSPFAITQILLILSVFSMFMVVNFIANTALRNDSDAMAEIVFTKPIKPFGYSLGRFAGSYLVCLTVFTMVPLGTFFGTLMPWVDAERIGPNSLTYYLVPFITFSVTTILVLAALFYAAAQRFRSVMAVYVIALGLFLLYTTAGQIFDEPHQRTIRALIDPFGLYTFGDYSRYWTAFEKNSLVSSFTGLIAKNRLLWLSIGIFALLLGGRLFKPLTLSIKKSKKDKNSTQEESIPFTNVITYKPQTNTDFDQLVARTKLEIKQVFKNPAFLILLLFSVAQLITAFFYISGMFGSPNWPLTQTMVELVSNNFGLMIIIIITYYTADIVWRERTVGIGDITDSMPVHNLTFWLSKLIAVVLIILALHAIGMLAAIGKQLLSGHSHIELGQYIISLLYFYALPYCLTAVLAFFIQALSPNKYVGMLVFVAYIFGALALNQLGIEHNMFEFGSAPFLQYSDLNGYGGFLQTQNWYMLYWTALSVLLGLISYGLWRRGPSSSVKQRIKLLPYQLGKKGYALAGTAFAVFIGTGAYIHYNTKVVNEFIGRDQGLDLRYDYEQEFIEFEDDNFPTITSIDTNINIFPSDRRIEAEASINVKNKSSQAITRFLVNLPRRSKEATVEINGGKLLAINERFNIAWFEFEKELQPNEERQGKISSLIDHTGFKDRDEDFTVVENGTFIDNFSLFPTFGFNPSYKISDRHERRKRDLEPLKRAYPLEDSSRYQESFFGKGIDFIKFSATLSTSSDQLAIAPGYLQKEWQENGRNYYRYEMDSPMINFFSIMSADLKSRKTTHQGVNVEVYYHKDHHWNVNRMIEATNDSLDYFQSAFGPYQHKQMRIIEFPGYRGFAQSFANTVPYSERIGFITDLRDPDDIDPVYYVTAHELAHQWWGHQLGAANVQGSAILSETLSQYSALMLMERKYGEVKLRKFLTYELDRYLRGRTAERIEEMPLMRSESQQYLHYRKGSVVMMALKYKLGENRINLALKNLLEEFKFRDDLYPTTIDLLKHLEKGASEEEKSYIQNLFAQITLYDLRATEASSKETESGDYEINFTVNALQFSADGKGQETEQAFKEQVEIVLFSEDPNDFTADNKIIYNQQHELVSGQNTIKIIAKEKPSYIGVDPFVRFIDRDTGNNVIKL